MEVENSSFWTTMNTTRRRFSAIFV